MITFIIVRLYPFSYRHKTDHSELKKIVALFNLYNVIAALIRYVLLLLPLQLQPPRP